MLFPSPLCTSSLCEPFNGDNGNDVANFFETLIGNFEGIVQYNKDNKAFEGSTHDNVTIDTLCDIMTQDSDDHEHHLDQDHEMVMGKVGFLQNIEDGLKELSQDIKGKDRSACF